MRETKVTAADLKSFVYEKRLESLVGEYSQDYHRQIDYLVGTGEYVVLDHRETVWTGRDEAEALEAYYSIPRR